MKIHLCTVIIGAMALGVTARPSVDGGKPQPAAVRLVRGGVVGEVFGRDYDADKSPKYNFREPAKMYGRASPTGSIAGGSSASTTSSPSSGSSGSSSSGSLPPSSGTSALSAVKTVAAGESFDGGMVMFDRGVSCTGQSEGGDSDAVFQLEDGASISNVIIGPNQIEGIHCQGACSLTNVWWSAVCEDAFTIKNQEAGETTTISGGGAFGATDKVLQHNGAGTLSVSGFTVEDFGKLYRSCGNCDSMYERHVVISDVTASNGDLIAGINSNYGDTAKISGLKTSGVDTVCERFEGNESGDEPKSIGTGSDGTSCIIA